MSMHLSWRIDRIEEVTSLGRHMNSTITLILEFEESRERLRLMMESTVSEVRSPADGKVFRPRASKLLDLRPFPGVALVRQSLGEGGSNAPPLIWRMSYVP
jgi:hypothetical protein